MSDLLALSAKVIADGDIETPTNRITTELSEVAPGIAVIEAFSHIIALDSGDGLVLSDTSLAALAPGCLASLRGWSRDRIAAVLYTHGHVDHVGGAQTFIDDAARRSDPPPAVYGHENVDARFDRYELTRGYNSVINARQFGRSLGGEDGPAWPTEWVRPTDVVGDAGELAVGDLRIELRHARGETDDHLWGWIPEQRAILAGDFVTWVFPNAGNPQKVQRYPLEWAAALRDMIALGPDLLLPAHGLPVGGELVVSVLDDLAGVLETLVADVLELMNAGERLDTIVHSVAVSDDHLAKPYMRPVYDEPEFVIRNIWRLYGGWYDGNPARLKPASDAKLATEVTALAGGRDALVARARAVSDLGDHRLASQLIEWATAAGADGAPQASAHEARAEIYRRRRETELSLMARGVFGWAERESAALARRDP